MKSGALGLVLVSQMRGVLISARRMERMRAVRAAVTAGWSGWFSVRVLLLPPMASSRAA